ncbi:MAG TPA: alpha/beta hydrolase [Aldersonia sp.]
MTAAPERTATAETTLRAVDPRLAYAFDAVMERHPLLAWSWGLLKLDFTGMAFAGFFFCWSMTPSLLPRSWFFQGVVSGITSAAGYGVGVVVGWFVYRRYLSKWHRWPPPPRVLLAIKLAIPVLTVVLGSIMIVAAARWQRQLADLMGAESPSTIGYFRAGVLAVLIGALLLTITRVLRDLARLIARALRAGRVPRSLANVLAVAVVAFLLVGTAQIVLIQAGMSLLNTEWSTRNDATREGAVQPTAWERSGSPGSLVPWDTLGYQGRNFVSGGLTPAELSEANGAPAKTPIRLYVGLESATDPEDRMQLLLAELDRTGAWDRRAIVVVPTTGTGWVNPTAVRAVETMFNGDTAIVATQYSYLPSSISFLTDRAKAEEAGSGLVHTVRNRLLMQPENRRPKLFVYGESLGTEAGEGAFADLSQIREQVDGVLWVGPPNANRIWSNYVQRRDPGTTEVQPTYAGGLLVRFADSPEDIYRPNGPWLYPRVLYMQHPSDPVVWWSPRLLFQRPDWLEERPGFDRLPAMSWFPIVTFWQVTADLANAAGVPDGHGHNYGSAVLDGWVAIAAPEGWSPADTERVRDAMEKYAPQDGPEK